jgi:hypothetical protein
LLFARCCLFSILAATLHNWRPLLHLQSEDAPCCGDMVEVMGEWRKLYDEELCDLYSSPSINRIIKLRRMMGCSTNGGEEERV